VKRFASVVLVDSRGWVLLQERDEHPVLDPERWGFVGGSVEPGETYPEAAHRELAEETGLADVPLVRFGRFEVVHDVGPDQRLDEFELYAATTDLTDADISLGEGRQIVFVDPVGALHLDLTAGARVALPVFLASQEYDAMVSPGVS
jgi:8-oxo-dGTP diphosphatase